MTVSVNLAQVNYDQVRRAAVALVQALIHPEFALRVTERTGLSQIPSDYMPVTTVQVNSIVYSLWQSKHAVGRFLVRLEGVGIFRACFEDEEPAGAEASDPSAVVYSIAA